MILIDKFLFHMFGACFVVLAHLFAYMFSHALHVAIFRVWFSFAELTEHFFEKIALKLVTSFLDLDGGGGSDK